MIRYEAARVFYFYLLQVSWCYKIESSKYQTRDERRLGLREYGIQCCCCEACDVEGDQLAQSDSNRLELKRVEQKLSTTFDAAIVPALIRRKKKLFQEEGVGEIKCIP